MGWRDPGPWRSRRMALRAVLSCSPADVCILDSNGAPACREPGKAIATAARLGGRTVGLLMQGLEACDNATSRADDTRRD
jgi:hypothetical protein